MRTDPPGGLMRQGAGRLSHAAPLLLSVAVLASTPRSLAFAPAWPRALQPRSLHRGPRREGPPPRAAAAPPPRARMAADAWTEQRLELPGGFTIAAKVWGDPAAAGGAPHDRWLALHGWADNAATFDALAPLLLQGGASAVVCIDAAGHGLSDHRPLYHDSDAVLDAVRAADALGWTRRRPALPRPLPPRRPAAPPDPPAAPRAD